MPSTPLLIPELDVSDLDRSLSVYIDVLGFRLHVSRPEERFAYLIREGVYLMLEEIAGPGRRFHTAPMEHPFGRGMNLQIEVTDVDALYASVQQAGLASLFLSKSGGIARISSRQAIGSSSWPIRMATCFGSSRSGPATCCSGFIMTLGAKYFHRITLRLP